MKTTSLELSKKLREAGAKQVSQYTWVRVGTDAIKKPWDLRELQMGIPSWCREAYSSFDCHELLMGLPQTIDQGGIEKRLYLDKCPGGYNARYGLPRNEVPGSVWCQVNPAEALGKLKLWCLKNGHINKEQKQEQEEKHYLEEDGLYKSPDGFQSDRKIADA